MATKTEMLATVKATVEMFARRWARTARGHLDFDDLVQVGYMAALKAAETFDPKHSAGAAFSTYCRVPVNGAMKNAVASWRGSMLSLDAPVGDDEGSTYLDAVVAEVSGLKTSWGAEQADNALEAAERDALVRSLVDKAIADFTTHRDMARLIVERLVEGAQGEERFRAEGGLSVRDIGDKFGVSRQTVLNVEKKLRARLAEVLEEAR